MIKQFYKSLKTIGSIGFLWCMLLGYSPSLLAENQQRLVSGTVTDESGMPMAGVNILIEGTNRGTQTDFDGKYSIETVNDTSTLVFSYVGFVTQKIVVNNQDTINVSLKEDLAALDEVVVIGYGTSNKRDLIGSVTQLNSEDIEDLPVASVDQALVGQTAGIQFRQTGNPAGGPQVLIRGISSLGNNAPLYVVDGIPLTSVSNSGDNFLLNNINPADIESISVLKDAASKAIYGNRASNGVIIIKTKQGKKGKTQFNANVYSSIGWTQDFDRPNNLNAVEMAIFQKERLEDRYLFNGAWGGLEQAHYTRIQDYIAAAENDPALAKGTDWFDEITRTSVTTDYFLSASGGSDNIVFNISGGFRDQEGVVIGTDVKRLTLRANVEANLTDWLRAGVNIAPSFVTNNSAATEPNSGGYSAYNAVNASYWVDPTAPVYDEFGNLTQSTHGVLSRVNFAGNPVPFGSGMFWTANPVFKILERVQQSKTNTFNMSAFLEVSPLKNLSFRTTANVNYRNRSTFNYTPKTLPLDGLTPDITGRPNSGSSASSGNTTNFILDNQLTYINTFNDVHNVEATFVASLERRKGDGLNISASNFVDEDFIFPSFGNTSTDNINNFQGAYSLDEINRLSYLGRASYNYDSKYYLSTSYRRDASSKFSSQSRWGDFYAVSAAWRVSEEKFWEPLKNVISDFKIESGYGITGNDAGIGNFASQGNINSTNYILGGAQVRGYALVALPNNNLTWEESEELNFGLDIGLFNMFNLEVDYYDITSKGFLGNTTIPTATGLGGIIDNVGSIQNKGWEFNLTTRDLIPSQDFSYSFNANATINKNEVLELSGDDEFFIGQAGNGTRFAVVREGDPVGLFRGFKILGFYSQEDLDNPDVAKYPQAVVGSPKVFDGNGDGVIEFSQEDYVDLGDPNQDLIFGMRHNFAYKNFDLSVLLNGAIGFDIYDQRSQQMHNLDGQFNVDRAVFENRYRPGVPTDIIIPATGNLPNGAIIEAREETPLNSISVPTTKQNTTRYWRSPNSYHIKAADYLWIKNITLGYNFDKNILGENAMVSRMRLYASAQNPFVFSKYKLGSPEVQKNSDNLVRGVNEGSYPNAATFTLGLNITF
ncbi:TonB-linked SusC/RagA family outer membrane protein [Jejuia pallidilutea]|uniref:TonB-linked SusC/RagA family outer membrane protein n=1 Tax=Jejuia pallidilutea TaxID=504487 RepID=A0A362XCK1_9FLAO|nr:TonB-dependent receptor [Jejuia pallidilutea]PQV48843.1 TonB-linked SusC/RagA family outer membrane protein [Jejuia pallidilutea]